MKDKKVRRSHIQESVKLGQLFSPWRCREMWNFFYCLFLERKQENTLRGHLTTTLERRNHKHRLRKLETIHTTIDQCAPLLRIKNCSLKKMVKFQLKMVKFQTIFRQKYPLLNQIRTNFSSIQPYINQNQPNFKQNKSNFNQNFKLFTIAFNKMSN